MLIDSRIDVSQGTRGQIEISVSELVVEIVGLADSSRLVVIDSIVAVAVVAVVVIETDTLLALTCSHRRPSVEVGEAQFVVASISAMTPLASVRSVGAGLVAPQVRASALLAWAPF